MLRTLGISLLLCCSSDASAQNPAPVPPHYRCERVGLGDGTDTLFGFEMGYQQIEEHRLHCERMTEIAVGDTPIPLRLLTDKHGIAPLDKTQRTSRAIGAQRLKVSRSIQSGRHECRVLVWGDYAASLLLAYLARRYNLTLSAATALLLHFMPSAVLSPQLAGALENWTQLHKTGYHQPYCLDCSLVPYVLKGGGEVDRTPIDFCAESPHQPIVKHNLRSIHNLPSVDAVLQTPQAAYNLLESNRVALNSDELASLFVSSLELIDLSLRCLNFESAEALAFLLRGSSVLKSLRLFGCGLDDEGLGMVVGAMVLPNCGFDDDEPLRQYNSTLVELDIGGNTIGVVALASLRSLAKHNRSLHRLALDSIDTDLSDFFDALLLHRSPISALSLDDTSLSPVACQKLTKLLEGGLTELSIRRVALNLSHVASHVSPRLEILIADGNPLLSCEALKTLASSAPKLGQLGLSGCKISRVECLLPYLTPILSDLDLSYNPIERDSFLLIIPILTSFCNLISLRLNGCRLGSTVASLVMDFTNVDSLRELRLDGNDMHDSCAESLLNFLLRASALYTLGLRDNGLTREGLQPIVEALAVRSGAGRVARVAELTVLLEGNPCGAWALGMPALARSKKTALYIPWDRGRLHIPYIY
jgi:Ran GTPase-activating protein (RanGAP) involved in mRNA processing and transport